MNYECISLGGIYADIDKDGFLDFVENRVDPENGKYSVKCHFNSGCGSFDCVGIPITAHGFNADTWFDIMDVADMDNDGYLDILTMKNYNI